MKRIKNIVSFLVVLTMVVSMFPFTALAAEDLYEQPVIESKESIDVAGEQSTTEAIPLQMGNIRTVKAEEGGIEVRFDLLQQNATSEATEDKISNRAIGWIPVGYGSMKMRLLSGNGIGYFDWKFSLDNGDVITGVKGTLVCEEANFPGINYAKETVNETYDIGTQFANAAGQETFDFYEEDYQKKVKFKWSGFRIYGVTSDYSCTNGSKTGNISDFS